MGTEKKNGVFTIEGLLKIAEEDTKFKFDLSDKSKFELIQDAFKIGIELAENKWKEKTRWIPLDERLPKVRPWDYKILARKGETCFSYWIIDSFDIDELKKMADFWKEIEL